MTKAEIDLLPTGWMFQSYEIPTVRPAVHDRFVIIHAPAKEDSRGNRITYGGYVTIDFQYRTFNLGMTRRHEMRANSFSGRGWRVKLVAAAIACLAESVK